MMDNIHNSYQLKKRNLKEHKRFLKKLLEKNFISYERYEKALKYFEKQTKVVEFEYKYLKLLSVQRYPILN